MSVTPQTSFKLDISKIQASSDLTEVKETHDVGDTAFRVSNLCPLQDVVIHTALNQMQKTKSSGITTHIIIIIKANNNRFLNLFANVEVEAVDDWLKSFIFEWE